MKLQLLLVCCLCSLFSFAQQGESQLSRSAMDEDHQYYPLSAFENDYKYRLDSTVSYFDRDSLGLHPSSSTSNRYDEDGSIIERISYKYDKLNKQWLRDSRSINRVYNDNGGLISFDYEHYDRETGVYVLRGRIMREYNAQGRVKNIKAYSFDAETKEPVLSSVVSYEYSGEIISKYEYIRLRNDTMVYGYRYTNVVEDGRIVEYQNQSYSNGAWTFGSKTTSDYDDDGSASQKTFVWSRDNEEWNLLGRVFVTYDNEDRIVENLSQIPIEGDSISWLNSGKTTYEYSPISEVQKTYTWNESSEKWKLSSERRDEFNEVGYITKTEEFKVELDSNYVKTYLYEAFFTKISTVSASEQNNESSIHVFPNPTSGYLRVDASDAYTLHIYSPSGELLRVLEGLGKQSVDVSFLKQGMYMYTISSEGRMSHGKFLKF